MIMRLPARLFKRRPESNKGDFGHVFILAGSLRLTGAAVLSARAVMRAGAGSATLGIPKSLHSVFASRLTEVMTLPLPETSERSVNEKALYEVLSFTEGADCLLLGPGLSRNPATQRLIRLVVSRADLPMIIDADGLNALAGHLDILKKTKSDVVLTPHPKELARLSGLSLDKIRSNRKEVAKDFALRYNITLVLKGDQTVVADGEGKVFINNTGNPGMATAGSGDVLAGVIAAFVALGLDPFDAAKYGVYVHGLAGDLAADAKTQISLIASDIIEYLPVAFKKIAPK